MMITRLVVRRNTQPKPKRGNRVIEKSLNTCTQLLKLVSDSEVFPAGSRRLTLFAVVRKTKKRSELLDVS